MSIATHETPQSVKRAVCTACAEQCGLLVELQGTRILRIAGDKEHPRSAGFICPKGASAHRLHYDETRLQQPLKRAGARGSGRWRQITWDEALDEIAGSIAQVIARYGAEALAYDYGTFHGSDWAIGERFMNLLGSPNSIGQDKVCVGPTALGEALTYGYGPTTMTAPVPGETRCVMLWGMRPSASRPLLWKEVLRARKGGAKLIVIDPERTHEARNADLWLQPAPGSDVALALSLVHCVITEGMYDAEFVNTHTVGFDELRSRAAEYSPQRVAGLCRIEADDIVRAARMLGENLPATVNGGNGLCQSGSTAVQNGRALACLIAITGNLEAPGGHRLAGPPRDIVANGAAFLAEKLPPEQRRKRLGAARFPYVGSGFDDLDGAMSARWYGQHHLLNSLSTGHEPTLWEAITSQEPYPVKAVIIQAHNAMGSSANAGAVDRALRSDELDLVVVHDLFMNATAQLADYVLPASHWLEKPFYSTGLGYSGSRGDYLEAEFPCVPAEAEHRSDYELFRDLGRRLGQERDWPETAEEFWDGLLRPAGLDFAFAAQHLGPLTGQQARSSGDPDERRPGYGTPSGKVELTSSLLRSWGMDPLPFHSQPEILSAWEEAYPLTLITGGRVIQGFHQTAHQTHAFRRRHPDPIVRLHGQTAEDAGVAAGQWVRIETPMGTVRQKAQITDALAPGVVHADRWWYPERAGDEEDPFGFWSTNINVCTDDSFGSCDPVSGAWLLRGIPCRIAV